MKTTIKTADSMKAAAAMLKLPFELVQRAKTEGCTAFRGTRVYLAELSAWVKQYRLDEDADWLAACIKALSRERESNRRSEAEEFLREHDFDVSDVIEQLERVDADFIAGLNLKFIRDVRAAAAEGDLSKLTEEPEVANPGWNIPPSATPTP